MPEGDAPGRGFPRIFDTGLAISIFRDNSTRTRFSFASAVNALGLGLSELDEEKSQIAHGETVRETANMISFLAEVIGIRDDMYLGEGNRYMREVGAAVQEGYAGSAAPAPRGDQPAVRYRPSDPDPGRLAHLRNQFGSLKALRGKKIAMTWAYSPSYGKPLSVPQGIIGLMTRFGMDVSLAYPEGYELIPEVVELARENANASGGSFHVGHSMEEAFTGADVVYPKSWAPFQVMQQRTALLKKGDRPGSRIWRSNVWRKTPAIRDGSATKRRCGSPKVEPPCTCTACPPTSPASAVPRAKWQPRSSNATGLPPTGRPDTNPLSSPR